MPAFAPNHERSRARSRARAHRKNTHFLFFLHGFCLPPVARRLCRLSLEIPARRGRDRFRGWVSRLVHRIAIARARDSLARRDEKTRREDVRVRRRASRVDRVRSRSRSTHPSRASFKGGSTCEARGVERGGARDLCMCRITGLMVCTIKCSTLVFLFVKAMCGTPARSARVVGRQRPAGGARRRARDGDSR